MVANTEAHKKVGIEYADSVNESRRLAAEVGLILTVPPRGSDRWSCHDTYGIPVFTASNQLSLRQKIANYKQGQMSGLGLAWWEVDNDHSDACDIKVTNASLAQSVVLALVKQHQDGDSGSELIWRLWYCTRGRRVCCISVKHGGVVCYKPEFDQCLQEWATTKSR